MKLRITVQTNESPVPSDPGMPFSSLTGGRVPRAGTLLSSIAVHVVVIVLIAAVSQQVALWSKDDEMDWSRYTVEPLRIHLAEPLIFRQTAPANRRLPSRSAAGRCSTGTRQGAGTGIARAGRAGWAGIANTGRECQQCTSRDPT